VRDLVAEMEAEKANTGSVKVADIMNELSKPDVESLLGALETVSKIRRGKGAAADLPVR
jgi:flagellar motor switch protein FliG